MNTSVAPGQEVKSLVYGEILRLDTLLGLQRPIGASDGLYFIVVHQAAELWFKVILHELELARDAISSDGLSEACYRLRRVVAVEDVLVAQIRTLVTLSPARFGQIRALLGDSSGFQSAQFREIEFISGLKEARYLDQVRVTEPERERLIRRLGERSLRDAMDGLFIRHGMTPLGLLREPHADPALAAITEALLDHDESFARWRAVHALVVERLIGQVPGTGGSEGTRYLNSTVGKRFFPSLWAARSELAAALP